MPCLEVEWSFLYIIDHRKGLTRKYSTVRRSGRVNRKAQCLANSKQTPFTDDQLETEQTGGFAAAQTSTGPILPRDTGNGFLNAAQIKASDRPSQSTFLLHEANKFAFRLHASNQSS